MSAIAGFVPLNGGSSKQACEVMLAALRPFGPDQQSLRTSDGVSFGRALHAVLPEDDFDRQPLSCAAARYFLVADARIDNRDEIAEALGIAQSELRCLSDADVLLRAWERFQLRSFDLLLGDIAMAVWDAAARVLTLARSPLSSRSLFYHKRPERIAFASMPHALFSLSDVAKRLDWTQVAAFAANLPAGGAESFFDDIFMVRQGEAVEFGAGKQRSFRIWDFANRPQLSPSDFGAALRFELDRAVEAQMRRRSGPVASHLSAGRDSSAVTVSAALALRGSGQQLIALTGAPQAGFAGPAVGSRLADESGLAVITAGMYPEITHVVCRSRPRPIGRELRKLSSLHHCPISNPSALHWEAEIYDEARRHGARVLLSGSMGNYSISTNGPHNLRDIWLQRGASVWWHHARQLGGASWDRWRSIANLTFGPDLPVPLHTFLLRAGGRSTQAGFDVSLLRHPVRGMAEDLRASRRRQAGMEHGYREFRKFHLMAGDDAQRISLALAGLDMRDPTRDRRLVELCLAIPPEMLASRPVEPSPVYERAFSGRIPGEVMYNRARGYQGADWYQLFDRDQVRGLFEQFARNPAVDALFDLEAISERIQSWPQSGSRDWARLAPYRNEVLRALALADFVDLHFPR